MLYNIYIGFFLCLILVMNIILKIKYFKIGRIFLLYWFFFINKIKDKVILIFII